MQNRRDRPLRLIAQREVELRGPRRWRPLRALWLAARRLWRGGR